jgi:uncharacterized protein YcbK (DUF882 family)
VQGNSKDVTASRRHLLALGAGGAAAMLLPSWAHAAESDRSSTPFARPQLLQERRLAFRHRHTGETVNVVYYADGLYIPAAIKQITHLMRDHRTDQEMPIDPALFDLLFALQMRLGRRDPFEIYSGYRSPSTNALLRQTRGRSVAKHSLHMQGMAADIGIERVSTYDIAKAALILQEGGVGFYRRSNFVHVDVGPVRSWGV